MASTIGFAARPNRPSWDVIVAPMRRHRPSVRLSFLAPASGATTVLHHRPPSISTTEPANHLPQAPSRPDSAGKPNLKLAPKLDARASPPTNFLFLRLRMLFPSILLFFLFFGSLYFRPIHPFPIKRALEIHLNREPSRFRFCVYLNGMKSHFREISKVG